MPKHEISKKDFCDKNFKEYIVRYRGKIIGQIYKIDKNNPRKGYTFMTKYFLKLPYDLNKDNYFKTIEKAKEAAIEYFLKKYNEVKEIVGD